MPLSRNSRVPMTSGDNLPALVSVAMPTILESAASIGDNNNDEDDDDDDGHRATKKRKGLDDILEIDKNVFPSDIVVDHDGIGGMALSQVSGMTSSPAVWATTLLLVLVLVLLLKILLLLLQPVLATTKVMIQC